MVKNSSNCIAFFSKSLNFHEIATLRKKITSFLNKMWRKNKKVVNIFVNVNIRIDNL